MSQRSKCPQPTGRGRKRQRAGTGLKKTSYSNKTDNIYQLTPGGRGRMPRVVLGVQGARAVAQKKASRRFGGLCRETPLVRRRAGSKRACGLRRRRPVPDRFSQSFPQLGLIRRSSVKLSTSSVHSAQCFVVMTKVTTSCVCLG